MYRTELNIFSGLDNKILRNRLFAAEQHNIIAKLRTHL